MWTQCSTLKINSRIHWREIAASLAFGDIACTATRISTSIEKLATFVTPTTNVANSRDTLLEYAALRNERKSIRPRFSETRGDVLQYAGDSRFFKLLSPLSPPAPLSPPHIIKRLFITADARLQHLFQNMPVHLLFEIRDFYWQRSRSPDIFQDPLLDLTSSELEIYLPQDIV